MKSILFVLAVVLALVALSAAPVLACPPVAVASFHAVAVAPVAVAAAPVVVQAHPVVAATVAVQTAPVHVQAVQVQAVAVKSHCVTAACGVNVQAAAVAPRRVVQRSFSGPFRSFTSTRIRN